MISRSDKIRVLIVDDSFFMKKLLKELLLTDEMIEVVGQAKDGEEAVVKARELKPDVITMDYNMPGLNGVHAIQEILADPNTNEPSIIMISAYTGEGSEEAMEALRVGAVDFIQKPSGELSLDIDKIKDEILEKVHIASRARVRTYTHIKRVKKKKKRPRTLAVKVVVIGSSTGGPPIVEDILTSLPDNFPAAVVVAQHMPEFFTNKFAERLDRLTALWVKRAQDGDTLKAGQVIVAPADTHFSLEGSNGERTIHLRERHETHRGPRPNIDEVMGEVAENYGSEVIGIVLTGMGDDGRKGI